MPMVRLALLISLVLAWAPLARAEEASSSAVEEPRAASGELPEAKAHFEAALVHYREGHYRSAVAELEAALNLDPAGKDLLFNLALVHEKLGQLDQAITALERYAELEKDARELERARQWIQRMKGARAELAPPAVPARAPMPPPASVATTAAAVEPHSNKAWILATAGIAVAATTVGAIFGVRALSLRPGPNPSTGPGTSVEDLRAQQAEAESSALVADIAFAVGLASSATCAVLWLGEPSGRAQAPSASLPLGVTVRGAF